MFAGGESCAAHYLSPCCYSFHSPPVFARSTKAEIDVLRLIAAGNANKQIADLLSITEDTVTSRVKNILSKLGANDRTHAAVIGMKRGIIEL